MMLKLLCNYFAFFLSGNGLFLNISYSNISSITPTNPTDVHCHTSQNCLTLGEWINRGGQSANPLARIKLVLLPGVHKVSSEDGVVMNSNAAFFTLIGDEMEHESVIMCM